MEHCYALWPNCRKVLDYLDIPWRDPAHWYLNADGKQIIGQMNIFDFITDDGMLIETN